MARGYRRHRRNYEEYNDDDDDEPDYPERNSPSDNELEHDILDARAEYSQLKTIGLICVVVLSIILIFIAKDFVIAYLLFIILLSVYVLKLISSYLRMRSCENRYRGIIGIRVEFKKR